MARPTKFTRDQILDGACAAVARHGRDATIAQVSEEIGAPTGSIYHRFRSREDLFVSLWLRSIRRFQVGLLAAGRIEDPTQALRTFAVHSVRYCREHQDEALVMTMYRQQSLLEHGPAWLHDEIRTLNDEVNDLVARLCERRYGRVTPSLLELVMAAARDCPLGLARKYIGHDIPRWIDDAVGVAVSAILALGDDLPARKRM